MFLRRSPGRNVHRTRSGWRTWPRVFARSCRNFRADEPPLRRRPAKGGLVGAAVLSGNRNFQGRINPAVDAAYLASPPLVVAYALAGSVLIDLARDPIGRDAAGKPVHLAQLWPTDTAIEQEIARAV